MRQTKQQIRNEVRARRPEVSGLKNLSPRVIENLRNHNLFKEATSIGAYMPLPDEVDIAPLFKTPGKRFFIPAFDESTRSYRMALYTPELKRGRFDIPEPEQPVWAGSDEIDLILIPGTAFDRSGNRLGRGGGFYDRLLPLYPAQRLGIGFGFQLVDAVPSEKHDIRMDALLTEQGFLSNTANNRQVRRSEVY